MDLPSKSRQARLLPFLTFFWCKTVALQVVPTLPQQRLHYLPRLLPIPSTYKLNGSSLDRPDVDLMFAKWAFNNVRAALPGASSSPLAPRRYRHRRTRGVRIGLCPHRRRQTNCACCLFVASHVCTHKKGLPKSHTHTGHIGTLLSMVFSSKEITIEKRK